MPQAQIQNKNPLDRLFLNYNFSISTKYGNFRASKVRNIEQSLEVEAVREGGLNHSVHALVCPSNAIKKLIFERGCCEEYSNLRMDRLIGKPQTDNVMTIIIYDREHKGILKTYEVSGWMVIKWQISNLDALAGAVLIETVEVAYETLISGDLI